MWLRPGTCLLKPLTHGYLLYYIHIISNFSDVLGVVKSAGEVTTVVGRQSQKETAKRDLQLVDQTGMVVNLTLWGSDVSS